MDIYYVNHLNERIDLDSDNIILQYQELYDYSWDSETVNGKIAGFYRDGVTIPVTVTVTADTDEEYFEILEEFYSTISKDIVSVIPGRLYLGSQYLECYISGDLKADAFMGVPIQVKNLTVVTDRPSWIREEVRSFTPIPSGNEQDESYLDYEYDYSYDYTMPYGGDVIWNVDHFAPCEFLMTVFGPAVDPRVVINGHSYQIYTTLDTNEYLKIDSRENIVIKYLANGIQQDVYDLRAKQESVFEPIMPRNVRVVWSGEFGFDLTLFCERSEPRWKTQNS